MNKFKTEQTMKKITLKNLHEATAQEVFDQCAVHLLTQKEKCEIEGDGCKYRIGNLKCAAGCFIDEDEYNVNMEGKIWSMLNVPDSHNSLINKLQLIHDCNKPEHWKERLILFCKKENLNTNAIDNLN